MGEEPHRLVSDFKRAAELESRNALFVGAHKVDGLQPLRHRELERRTIQALHGYSWEAPDVPVA